MKKNNKILNKILSKKNHFQKKSFIKNLLL